MPPEPGPSESPDSLARRVRGGDRELARLAARGLLPLAPGELIPLQVELAAGGDAELAAAARASLAALEPRLAAAYVGRDAGAAELGFFAAESKDRRVVEALIRRRDVPRRLLVDLASRLAPELQEVLARRQDALLEEPAIAEALERNPQLSAEVRRRLAEYRRHLLRRPGDGPADTAGTPGAADVADVADVAFDAAVPAADVVIAEPADEEMRQALAAAAAAPPGDGGPDETTGLTEAQVRLLPIPVRMRLTRGASRTLRQILIRDPSPVVARAVLMNNAFTEQEIEAIASHRSVTEEVLGEIARRREWIGQYRVALALVKNPRTPLALAVRLVARLAVRDLRLLSRDRNIPDAVRSTAARLYRIKRV